MEEGHNRPTVTLTPRDDLVHEPVFYEYAKSVVIGRSAHHMQVSDTLACGGGDCEVSRATEHSFGVEISAELGGELASLTGGISASIGITLTESWTNGKTTTCAGANDESVCIWVGVPY